MLILILKKTMKTSLFDEWTLQKLNNTFGLREVSTLAALEEWLLPDVVLEQYEITILDKLKTNLARRIMSFNEQELILKCIGTIITIANLDGNTFRAFSERNIEAVVNEYLLKGKPDLLLAKGTSDPQTPFYCLHEYKKSLENAGEPAGQCMAAMLAAQTLNDNPQQIIYGSYVVGREWIFMVLDGKHYAQSNAYIVTRDDIFDIVRILRSLRTKIANMLNDDEGW